MFVLLYDICLQNQKGVYSMLNLRDFMCQKGDAKR